VQVALLTLRHGHCGTCVISWRDLSKPPAAHAALEPSNC